MLNHHGAYVDLPESWIYLKIAVWKMMINYQFLAHPISDNQLTFLGLTVSGSLSHPVAGFPGQLAPWLQWWMDPPSVRRGNRQLIAGRLLRLERFDARTLRLSLAPLRKDNRAIQ